MARFVRSRSLDSDDRLSGENYCPARLALE
jgi:hypothetical protein